jgi:hypothetical protein
MEDHDLLEQRIDYHDRMNPTHDCIPCIFVSDAQWLHTCDPTMSEIRDPKGRYNSEIFLRNLLEADFVDLGINESADANSSSDQRCRKLHG